MIQIIGDFPLRLSEAREGHRRCGHARQQKERQANGFANSRARANTWLRFDQTRRTDWKDQRLGRARTGCLGGSVKSSPNPVENRPKVIFFRTSRIGTARFFLVIITKV